MRRAEVMRRRWNEDAADGAVRGEEVEQPISEYAVARTRDVDCDTDTGEVTAAPPLPHALLSLSDIVELTALTMDSEHLALCTHPVSHSRECE